MENKICILDADGQTKAELSGSGEVVLGWKYGEYAPGR